MPDDETQLTEQTEAAVEPTPYETETPKATPGGIVPDGGAVDEPVETIAPEEPLLVFAVAGDSRGLYEDEVGIYEGKLGGVNTDVVKRLLAAVKAGSAKPEFMLTLGDYGMGDKDADEAKAQYAEWLAAASEYYSVEFFYPLFGNHEAKCEDKAGIEAFGEAFSYLTADSYCHEEIYGKTCYLVAREGVNIFMLNTNCYTQPHRISDAVIEWMQQYVNKGERYNVIVMHEPLFPTGNHIGRSLDADAEQRDKLAAFIASLPGAVVFNGHEHQYNRRLVDASLCEGVETPFYQVTAAGMGAPFHETQEDVRGIEAGPYTVFHYVIASVYENRLEVTAYDIDGNVIDSFKVSSDG